MATAPSSCAGVLAKAPLKEPTAVRAALTTTMSVSHDYLSIASIAVRRRIAATVFGPLAHAPSQSEAMAVRAVKRRRAIEHMAADRIA